MKNTGKFTLRLSPEQLQFLKGLAEEQDRSISSVIRMLIYVEQENQIRKIRTADGV